jgi:pSer/pThr/pTyr-binding forkhead associated (FHA) protein
VLADARVSRSHSKIEYAPEGLFLIDQVSANGTWVNGNRIKKSRILPGDTIQIGNSSFRLAAPSAESSGEEMTIINTEADLGSTFDQMTLSVALNDTSHPQLVIHAPDRTWDLSLEIDSLSIGRSSENALMLDYAKVSRRHARIERRGEDFYLIDLNSTNGTWLGGARVLDHQLRSGEMFTIGPVQMVFKTAFASEQLTLVDETGLLRRTALQPVVFVPGMMGSELYQGSEKVWPNVKILFRHPELFYFTEETRLEPKGVLNDMIIVPNLITLEQYSRLGDYLVEELGYERGKDFLEFGYDWRRDIRQSAKRLAETIEAREIKPPITIIAHSLGTLVSRYYVERLGGKDKVGRLLLLGGPHQGVPKIVASLTTGPDLLPFGLMGERLAQLVQTFPSCYQILPQYACVTDQNGQKFNLLEDESWVKENYRPFLRDARKFRQELGFHSSVPTVSIFGYGLKTMTGLRVVRDQQGSWRKVFYDFELCGDSSIPESSAVLEGTEIHPVKQYHGTLYIDNDVKMRLKMELLRLNS